MICPSCNGERVVKINTPEGRLLLAPCLECMGSGNASWCDAAGPTDDAYHDRLEERACDHCGKPYHGPAVYCSFACALADATKLFARPLFAPSS
jgi:hypothetical protein